MNDKTYQPQEIIFTKGDPSEFAYVIVSGKVEILDNYPAAPVHLALLADGEIFGEMGLVDERPRSLTARAVTEARLRRISRDEFTDLILNQPEEAFRYLRMFFERLRAMNMRVLHRAGTSLPVPEKAADYAVTLIPQTPATNAILPLKGLTIEKFPFRIGRRSTRREDPLEINDLFLPDESPFNVSRNHFAIEKNGEGIFIHDRGSFLGTIVNGKLIGGHHHAAWTELRQGPNEVIAGSRQSPYRFEIDVTAV